MLNFQQKPYDISNLQYNGKLKVQIRLITKYIT